MFLPVSLSVPVGKLKALKADDTPLSRFAAALGGVALTQRLPTTFGSASRHASPACVDCILAHWLGVLRSASTHGWLDHGRTGGPVTVNKET